MEQNFGKPPHYLSAQPTFGPLPAPVRNMNWERESIKEGRDIFHLLRVNPKTIRQQMFLVATKRSPVFATA